MNHGYPLLPTTADPPLPSHHCPRSPLPSPPLMACLTLPRLVVDLPSGALHLNRGQRPLVLGSLQFSCSSCSLHAAASTGPITVTLFSARRACTTSLLPTGPPTVEVARHGEHVLHCATAMHWTCPCLTRRSLNTVAIDAFVFSGRCHRTETTLHQRIVYPLLLPLCTLYCHMPTYFNRMFAPNIPPLALRKSCKDWSVVCHQLSMRSAALTMDACPC